MFKILIFMKIIFKSVFLLSFALLACKKEAEEDSLKEEKVQAELPSFLVDLDLVIKKDDTLQLFYTESGENTFVGSKRVRAAVKGNEAEQTISFKLPGDVLPTRLRIDFGENAKQEPIEVKKFKMSYLDKDFEIKDTMFYQFFFPNNQIEWNRKNAILKVVKQGDEKYDPQFISREIMEMKLEKMAQ